VVAVAVQISTPLALLAGLVVKAVAVLVHKA
jgi:hypothetical protein